jgi:hypothetical protein
MSTLLKELIVVKVDALRFCVITDDAVSVEPVNVENDVNDNPGAFILVAFNVDTVIVDATASVFVETVNVLRFCVITDDAVSVEPVNVENDVNDNPGAFILVAVRVDTVIVDATTSVLVEMVDPVSSET